MSARRRQTKAKGSKYSRNQSSDEEEPDIDKDNDEEGSDASSMLGRRAKAVYKLDDLMPELQTKSKRVRVAALEGLAEQLRSVWLYDGVGERQAPLQTSLNQCIRKGDTKEVIAACNVYSLVAIQMGTETESDYASVLINYAKNATKPAQARAAVLGAISMLCFASHDLVEGAQAMRECEALFSRVKDEDASSKQALKHRPAAVLAAACRAWALMATVQDTNLIAGLYHDRAVGHLAKLLEHNALEVRTAAGEAIALVYSAVHEADEPDYGEEAPAEGSNDEHVDADELADMLRELSTESTKKKGKKERKEQRSAFREVVATVEEGNVPSETMTIAGQKEAFEGWIKLTQLARLKEVLEHGILEHLTHNEFMGEVFNIEIEPLSDQEEVKDRKRDQIWEAQWKAKETHKHRTQARKDKRAHMHRTSF